jgi:hypothetical protein
MKALSQSISILLLGSLPTLSLKAQLFELETTYDNGLFTFSFSDGYYPVAFGVTQASGFIDFNVSDAIQVTVPEHWLVSYYDGGFQAAYDGPFDVYPLGFETIEVSFFSDLSISEIGTSESSFTGIVAGPVVLENGFSQGIDLGNGSYVSAPVGYQTFYFDMPAYEGPQLTAQNLIDFFGFTADDIKPIAAGIELEGNEIRFSLKNVIEGATYMLQYKEDLNATTWVNIRTFTSEDLDENNSIGHTREGLSGFFQISIL